MHQNLSYRNLHVILGVISVLEGHLGSLSVIRNTFTKEVLILQVSRRGVGHSDGRPVSAAYHRD